MMIKNIKSIKQRKRVMKKFLVRSESITPVKNWKMPAVTIVTSLAMVIAIGLASFRELEISSNGLSNFLG
jgi:hypothetical protein